MMDIQWETTNAALRHRGLEPITVTADEMKTFHDAVSTPRTDIAPESKDMVVLEKKSLTAIQDTLHKLMEDCDRRQGLITDLIKTNNGLREEVKTAKSKSFMSQSSVSDCDESQNRDRPPTAKNILRENIGGNFNNNNDARGSVFGGASETSDVERRTSNTERELQEIKRRLNAMEIEERRRKQRQEAVIKQMRQKPLRRKHDGDFLDSIEYYETEMDRVENEYCPASDHDDSLLASGRPPISSRPTTDRTENSETQRLDRLHAVRNYDRQLKEAEDAMRKWKAEMKRMKDDLDSRPSLRDFNDAQNRIVELERLLESQNARSREEDNRRNARLAGADEVVLCLDTLKEKLRVKGSLDVVNQVEYLCHVHHDAKKAEKLLKKINAIVMENGDDKHKTWCHSSGHKLVETLKSWKAEMKALPHIRDNVERLHRRLLGSEGLETSKDLSPGNELVVMTESLLKDNSLPTFDAVRKIGDANQQTMVLIISHFQNLFDVKEVPNVITRMTDVYNKNKEIQNILRTLRDMLGLDEKTPGSWAVVDAVAQLSNAVNATSTRRLQEVLGVEELDSVVQQVGEHREFCPVFTQMLQKVMELLVVDSLESVLPAIQSLKLLATPAPIHQADEQDI